MKHTRKIVVTCILLTFLYAAGENGRTSLLAQTPILEPTTISSPGAYQLANNITGQIAISASNVCFDLNDYRMSATSNHCIIINSNVSRICIRNGSLCATSGNGIDIATGCSDIVISNIRAHLCTIGINAVSTDSLFIEKCIFKSNTSEGIKLTTCSKSTIAECKLLLNDIAIELDQTDDTHMYNCVAIANTTKGFSLTSCNRAVLLSCSSLLSGSGNANNACGFVANNGSHNTFKQCIAKGTTTTATGASNFAVGFLLQGTESKSSITECTASSTETPAVGSSIAYGIRLKHTSSTPTEVTSGDQGAQTNAILWHQHNAYLLTAEGGSSGDISLYTFDSVSGTLSEANNFTHGAAVNEVAWSPDSTCLAVVGAAGSGNYDIRIYTFDETSHDFVFVEGVKHGATVNSISWTPNGHFVAIGGEAKNNNEIRLYEFKTRSNDLKRKDSINHGAIVESVAWAPNSPFLAVGGAITGGNEVHVYELSPRAKTLTLRDSVSHGATVNSVAWTADGKFLAIGGGVGTTSMDIRIYEFDSGLKTLTLRDSQAHGAIVRSVTWSPDDAHLLIGGDTATSNETRIYSFDKDTKTLTLQDSLSHGGTVRAVSWVPDGKHFAISGNQISSTTHRVYTSLQFPSQCSVNNNFVYGTTGNSHKSSVGICASSGLSLIANNTAYDNDVNYRFVAGVHHRKPPETLLNISQ